MSAGQGEEGRILHSWLLPVGDSTSVPAGREQHWEHLEGKSRMEISIWTEEQGQK
jgi:hypothetical protein